MTFADRYPALFHVADRAALDGIRRHGLLSACGLLALHGGDPDCLRQNRTGYVVLAPGAALRRQGMRDAALRPRLHGDIESDQWRRFINGMVFLFPTEALARRLLPSEAERDQVILRYATDSLLVARVDLLTCRFNNGFIDRSPVATARRRHFDDYQPAAGWSGTPVKEVVARPAIPATIPFAVLDP